MKVCSCSSSPILLSCSQACHLGPEEFCQPGGNWVTRCERSRPLSLRLSSAVQGGVGADANPPGDSGAQPPSRPRTADSARCLPSRRLPAVRSCSPLLRPLLLSPVVPPSGGLLSSLGCAGESTPGAHLFRGPHVGLSRCLLGTSQIRTHCWHAEHLCPLGSSSRPAPPPPRSLPSTPGPVPHMPPPAKPPAGGGALPCAPLWPFSQSDFPFSPSFWVFLDDRGVVQTQPPPGLSLLTTPPAARALAG